MHDLTHRPPPRAVLPPTVAEPSYATQILTVTAWVLELVAVEPLTQAALDDALRTATAGIVGHLPAVVAESATLRARSQLPSYDDVTHAEYALRIRAAAKALG
ncbi:hypothetical protein AB0D33_01405 [Streptomyces sp. NPDC048404]|uniref:hypothetical protein n=1 Tax=unclassified Streptomyces TaxID=2593676 RepID=UPI00342C880B